MNVIELIEKLTWIAEHHGCGTEVEARDVEGRDVGVAAAAVVRPRTNGLGRRDTYVAICPWGSP